MVRVAYGVVSGRMAKMVKADADDKLDWVMGHINHPITEILQILERTKNSAG